MSVARALTLKEAIDPVELAQQRFTHVVRTAAFSILTRLRKHGACTRQEIAEELATLESVKLLESINSF